MFSKVGIKVFLGYYWIKTFFWTFCFAKILRTRKKKLKFGQISTKPGQNISRLPFLHHKLHEFSFPCHSLVSSFFFDPPTGSSKVCIPARALAQSKICPTWRTCLKPQTQKNEAETSLLSIDIWFAPATTNNKSEQLLLTKKLGRESHWSILAS